MVFFSTQLIRVSTIALPLLAVWLLLRCVRSLLRDEYEPEAWAYLATEEGETALIRHWECLIGRGRSCDVVIDRRQVSRTQAALIRSSQGDWTLYDLGGRADSTVQGSPDYGDGTPVQDGDRLSFAGVKMRFRDLNEEQRSAVDRTRNAPGRLVSPGVSLLILTAFQALLLMRLLLSAEADTRFTVALGFAALVLAEWTDYFLMRAIDRTGYEPESLAFFLSTLGMAVVASASPEEMQKQTVLLLAGIIAFLALGWWLRDQRRVKFLHWPVILASLALLAVNLLFGRSTNGATNWINIGSFSLQPSEFVKIAYIYVGAAGLDRLFSRRYLFGFILFSVACVGALALMGDFGTALIFFVTFLVIAFMRSGSFATIFLAISGAVLGVLLVLSVKPYVAQRFASWGHIWEDPLGAGWQQTRGLSAAASGGLFGVGPGEGWLKDIFASDTDMVFCLMCEELGLIIALCAMLALIILCFFAVRSAARGRSGFYVIAACSCVSLLLVQMSLNVFGSVDILPFTGVTFPFVSRGGSSLISCWAMLAFVKAGDTRLRASFSVKLPARFTKKRSKSRENSRQSRRENEYGGGPDQRDWEDRSYYGGQRRRQPQQPYAQSYSRSNNTQREYSSQSQSRSRSDSNQWQSATQQSRTRSDGQRQSSAQSQSRSRSGSDNQQRQSAANNQSHSRSGSGQADTTKIQSRNNDQSPQRRRRRLE